MLAITIPHDKLIAFCQQHPIRKMALFGSVLCDDYSPESDIDVLVEFDAEAHLTYFDLYDLETALTALLGRHVDLRTPQELSRYFRQTVLDNALVIYER